MFHSAVALIGACILSRSKPDEIRRDLAHHDVVIEKSQLEVRTSRNENRMNNSDNQL